MGEWDCCLFVSLSVFTWPESENQNFSVLHLTLTHHGAIDDD